MSTVDETEEAPPKTRSFYLLCSVPDRATVRIALDEGHEIAFGRSDASDVDAVIDHPRVSRRHALVGRSPAGVYVRDLGSRNGTVVGGETIHGVERRLGAGDVLEIGPMTVVVAAESSRFVVAGPAMRKLLAAAQRLARRKSAVLLLGEPGVGKALLAEWIHDASARVGKPFVRVDCGALPDGGVDAELFGAAATTKSAVEAAHLGTIHLADIDALPARAQERLFELLRTGTLARDGKPRAALDVRLVCSSRVDLRAAAASGHFHSGLYAHVGTVSLTVPPLRERTVEIPVLADHLLRRIAEPLGAPAPSLAPEALALLVAHPWPRNVSDLRDVLEVAFALSEDGRITPAELPAGFVHAGEVPDPPVPRDPGQRTVLRIAPDGGSFRIGTAPAISLARRGALRRVLLRLAHERDAGRRASPLSGDELFDAGWPGEKAIGQSAEGRLRTAIWTLRRMGLEHLLITTDDGYLLSAEVDVEWCA